jgi:hypothetical protein
MSSDAAQRAWVVRILIVVVGLVAAAIVVTQRGPSCSEWQAEYERAADAASRGVFDFVGIGPASERLRQLEADRPEGCARPDPP